MFRTFKLSLGVKLFWHFFGQQTVLAPFYKKWAYFFKTSGHTYLNFGRKWLRTGRTKSTYKPKFRGSSTASTVNRADSRVF
jgi:hypothetical protein